MGSPFSTALGELRSRRELLVAEANRLTRLIRELEALPASVTGPYVGPEIPSRVAPVVPVPPVFFGGGLPTVVIKPAELGRMSYAQAARAVIKRAMRPLSTPELLTFLVAGGRAVQGNDPYRTLYRTLMKSPVFKNVDKKWTLNDWDDPSEDLLMEK